MLNKTQLQNLSDNNITDDILIIPSAHRTANDGMIENGYADILTETQDTEVNIQSGGQISSMGIQFVKQGRRVTVSGWFRQTNGTTVPPSWIFLFKDTETADLLLPDDTLETYSENVCYARGTAITPNGTAIQIGMYSSLGYLGLHALENIPPNANTSSGNPSSAFYFSLTYFTKE